MCTSWYSTAVVDDEQPTSTKRRPREVLLAAVVDELAASGSSDLSLRELAAKVGSSHRMLLYHFGSKEQLLVAVAREVERQQQEALADLGDAEQLEPRQVAEAMWARITDPALAPRERLFFELYGQALMGRPGTTEILEGDIETWVQGAAAQLEAAGATAEQARVDARLSLAVSRGLLLDLLATGDRAAVDAAHARFFDLYERGR
jgi:AcrR family transcriptional regulator